MAKTKYVVVGCVVPNPQKNNPFDPRHPPPPWGPNGENKYDLREWQVEEIIKPNLVGKPIHINHKTTRPGYLPMKKADGTEEWIEVPQYPLLTGQEKAGEVTHVWTNPKDGSLHFRGLLDVSSDKIVEEIFFRGKWTGCSLGHVENPNTRTISSVNELSLCFEGARPGSCLVFLADDIKKYMRETGGIDIENMATDAKTVPPATTTADGNVPVNAAATVPANVDVNAALKTLYETADPAQKVALQALYGEVKNAHEQRLAHEQQTVTACIDTMVKHQNQTYSAAGAPNVVIPKEKFMAVLASKSVLSAMPDAERTQYFNAIKDLSDTLQKNADAITAAQAERQVLAAKAAPPQFQLPPSLLQNPFVMQPQYVAVNAAAGGAGLSDLDVRRQYNQMTSNCQPPDSRILNSFFREAVKRSHDEVDS